MGKRRQEKPFIEPECCYCHFGVAKPDAAESRTGGVCHKSCKRYYERQHGQQPPKKKPQK